VLFVLDAFEKSKESIVVLVEFIFGKRIISEVGSNLGNEFLRDKISRQGFGNVLVDL
jgi:hypothetical protein